MTPAEFQSKFSEFSDTATDVIQSELNFAEEMTEACRWGSSTLRERAIGYLTAHGLKVMAQASSGSSAAGLIVTSEKTGDLQRSYAAPASQGASSSNFQSTVYGREYLGLRRRVSGAFVAGMRC